MACGMKLDDERAARGVAAPAPARVPLAGVAIDNVTMDEAVARIAALVEARTPAYVVTPNVDHIVKLQRDEDFRQVYARAALVLADGMPLLWAARYLGTPLKAKVSGSDLFPRFCGVAAERGYRLFFLGGQPRAAEQARDALRQQHPALQVVGTCCPPFGFERDAATNEGVIEQIRAARPNVLFVGLGAPKQELWLSRHLSACGVPVGIGVGASFDFVAGVVRRAPHLVQRVGLEWLWRLVQEPRRLYRRYLIEDPTFFRLIWQQKRRQRGRA